MRIERVRVALTLVVTLLFLAPDARACHGATKPCHSHKVVHCQPCCTSTRVIKKTRTVVIDCPDPCLEITCPPGYRPDTVNGVVTCVLLPLAKPCGPNEIPLYTGKGTYICYDTTEPKPPQPLPPQYEVVCPPCYEPDTNGTVITCIPIIDCDSVEHSVDTLCPPGMVRFCTTDSTYICVDTSRMGNGQIRWEANGIDRQIKGKWYRIAQRDGRYYIGIYTTGIPVEVFEPVEKWRRLIRKVGRVDGAWNEKTCPFCD